MGHVSRVASQRGQRKLEETPRSGPGLGPWVERSVSLGIRKRTNNSYHSLTQHFSVLHISKAPYISEFI